VFVLLTTVAVESLEAAHEAAAPSGIGALGLDLKALLFQIANFVILLVVLRIFAYPAIVKVLEARRARIEEGLANATQMDEAKANLQKERENVLKQTHEAARALLGKSEEQARQMVEEGRSRAQEQAQNILERAQERIEQETQAARRQLKKEVVRLTTAAAQQVLVEKLDSSRDQELIERAVAQAKPL
jgi:F-type H+-transporting ATPase subunit b